MRHRSRLLVPFLALSLALAGCGGDDADPESTEGGPTSTGTTEPAAVGVSECPDDPEGENVLAVRTSEALGELSFVPASLEAAAGEVTIRFENPGAVDHSFVIEGTDIGMLAESGASCSTAATLEAGTYTVFCDIVGHREAGMETTLTVT